jgi:hypothetical protein
MNKFQLACLMYIAFGGAFYGYDFGMLLLLTAADLCYEDYPMATGFG